jgi:hypothetical protein
VLTNIEMRFQSLEWQQGRSAAHIRPSPAVQLGAGPLLERPMQCYGPPVSICGIINGGELGQLIDLSNRTNRSRQNVVYANLSSYRVGATGPP